MHSQRVNDISGAGAIILALVALVTVLWGYTQAPLPDEGTEAHIFQLSVAALLPVTLLSLATADWSRPLRSVRPLALAGVTLTLALVALYYLEHVFYPRYYP